MFPLLNKIIETIPSNNITYSGGLGQYNPKVAKKSFHNISKKEK
ncbi:hypothetical protein [Sulfurimonas sp.]|nr:hypothetical protein [Sulfurimonas sp.]